MATILNPAVEAKVRKFGAQLRIAGIPYEKLIVFGSHAKGNAKSWSDIDVCVVSDELRQDRFTERVRLMKLLDDSTIDIEPHPYNPQGLSERWDPLINEIRRYGILIS